APADSLQMKLGILVVVNKPVGAICDGVSGIGTNSAVTSFTAFIPTMHDGPATPVHAPPHAAKTEPASGVAVRVTWSPERKRALPEVAGDCIMKLWLGGVPVATLPDPLPVLVTDSWYCTGV